MTSFLEKKYPMKPDIPKAIRSLAEDPDNLSTTARIRTLYADILSAKADGVKNEILVKCLNEQGIEIDMKGFTNILYRLNKEEYKPSTSKANVENSLIEFSKPNTFKRTERK